MKLIFNYHLGVLGWDWTNNVITDIEQKKPSEL